MSGPTYETSIARGSNAEGRTVWTVTGYRYTGRWSGAYRETFTSELEATLFVGLIADPPRSAARGLREVAHARSVLLTYVGIGSWVRVPKQAQADVTALLAQGRLERRVFAGKACIRGVVPGFTCTHGDRGVATCGNCEAQWCDDCDPTPSALCHYCNGRGYSEAEVRAPQRVTV